MYQYLTKGKQYCVNVWGKMHVFVHEQYNHLNKRWHQNTALRDVRVFLEVSLDRIVIRQAYKRTDLIIFFTFAILVGCGVKMMAIETVTIGFQDYTLSSADTFYDIDSLENKLIEQGDKGIGQNGVSTQSCGQ
ncbi:MAG: hypothetical protein ACSLEX_02355 [Minisyncoccota bacterium]